jgi:hypothetical protein
MRCWCAASHLAGNLERSVRPKLQQIARNTIQALTALDGVRLEDLARSCQALTGSLGTLEEVEARSFLDEPLAAQRDLAVLARVLQATKANLAVMRRLSDLREGEPGYGPEPMQARSSTEAGRGDHKFGI